MPVTKKKGAIFAIYADSPARSTRSQITTAPLPTTSTLTSKSTSSPTKKSTAPRKALSAVQPKSVGFPSEPPSKLDKGKARAVGPADDSHTSTYPSVNPKSISRAAAPIPQAAKRVPPIASKRRFEIFAAPSVPPSPTASTRLPESPIKKTRATPRRPVVENKENSTPPVVDSPASRTRSKVRATPSAALNSPIQALRLTSRTAGAEKLVGDGRGTLTLKKGRAVAKMMKGSEVFTGDVLLDASEAYGAEGSAPSGFDTQRR